MGQYLGFRLIYGVSTGGDEDHLWDHGDGDGDLFDAIAIVRGARPIDWSSCPKVPWERGVSYEDRRAQEKLVYEEWKARPEVKAQREAWEEARAQVDADYPNLEQEWGGVGDSWQVDVIGIKGSGFEAHDAVTNLGDGTINAGATLVSGGDNKNAWDAELKRALAELGVDAGEPAWLGVISYG